MRPSSTNVSNGLSTSLPSAEAAASKTAVTANAVPSMKSRMDQSPGKRKPTPYSDAAHKRWRGGNVSNSNMLTPSKLHDSPIPPSSPAGGLGLSALLTNSRLLAASASLESLARLCFRIDIGATGKARTVLF
eukprot:CAMPEP_0172748852 /NCGR_PEP_ID=MMETSP1074-20121228/145971_1 /TAXON_ID=2916 /ORGANISM="Ceratium fusus, Strain PA161109" /LENGTH=131 /DNA_ID=CAMNT_0013580673 /DNA_START=250 /DNA_END=645 /DNA_ORIENTATION=+